LSDEDDKEEFYSVHSPLEMDDQEFMKALVLRFNKPR
jgi:hypothetical protein